MVGDTSLKKETTVSRSLLQLGLAERLRTHLTQFLAEERKLYGRFVYRGTAALQPLFQNTCHIVRFRYLVLL